MERFDVELLDEEGGNQVIYLYREDGELVKAYELAQELALALGEETDELCLDAVYQIIMRLTRE